MKNTMKKTLAIILTAIMLLSTAPIAFAEGNTYQVGDIVQFGSYPQSEVKDEILIAELNALAPEWEDWTSYGYYSGTGDWGTMTQGDWMRYTDITYKGNKYRGVKFTQYRPGWTYETTSHEDTYQDDNGYSTDTAYWFKFDSIEWRILDPSVGLVMSEAIIDSQPYSNTIYYNGSDDSTYSACNDFSYNNYASDYETSSIRQWLNNDFYNTAFIDVEKNEIKTTTLNNDGYYTSLGIAGYEALDSNETKDKIFLLSYNEVKNSKFGFKSNPDSFDSARYGYGSDYAKSQGLFVDDIFYNSSLWLLRSPGDNSKECCYVYSYSYSAGGFLACSAAEGGVRPALKINLSSAIIKSEYTPDMPDESDDPDTPSEPVDDCLCKCHKGGIVGFFFKILLFFQKLFGKNKVCACGVAH